MPRIKGWSKWKTEGMRGAAYIRYDSRNTSNFVLISQFRTYWRVYSYNGEIEKNFKTREQAVKFAINWMRRHPRG